MQPARDPKTIAIVFLSIALMAAVAGLGISIGRYNALARVIDDPELLTREQTRRVLTEIGKHMELPSSEEPSIATVNDVSQLGNQAFFEKAEKGHKVVIYKDAKKAILYDPEGKKIINVGSYTDSGNVAGAQSEN